MIFPLERPRVSVSNDVWPFGNPQDALDLYQTAGLRASLEIFPTTLKIPFARDNGPSTIEAMVHDEQRVPIRGVHLHLGSSKWPHQHTKSVSDWGFIRIADAMLPKMGIELFNNLETIGRLHGEILVNIHTIAALNNIEWLATLYRHAKYTTLSIENSPGESYDADGDLIKAYQDLGVTRVQGTEDIVHRLVYFSGGDTSVDAVKKYNTQLLKGIKRRGHKHIPHGPKINDSLFMQRLIDEEPALLKEWFEIIEANENTITLENQDKFYGVKLWRWQGEIRRLKRLNDGYLKLGLLRESDIYPK